MSPGERLTRMRAVAARGLAYSKGSMLILIAGSVIAIGVAHATRPVYRAECTVFAKARIRTDDSGDGAPSPEQIVRQSARLKDMLTTRGRLEMAIKTFHLYPETVSSQSMLDAVEEMKPHVGFRSLEGALYVISFEGDPPEIVQKVTAYLSDSLIDDYAMNDLDDLRRDADFLDGQEKGAVDGLEQSSHALTVFLAAHPEFAIEAKLAAVTFGPSPATAIPLLPIPQRAPVADVELAALYRERARLDGEVHGTGAPHPGASAQSPDDPLDESLAQAQASVEAAAKRVAEAQADLASKSNLTEDHPEMRTARMRSDAATRQLHEAKAAYSNLRLSKAGTGAPVPALAAPDVASKLRQVDAEIVARRSQLAKGDPATASPESAHARAANPAVSAAVELETEWQRRLRAVGEARSHHDDLELRARRSRLALEAAQVEANEEMAIVDPAVRPTHPSRGGRTNVALVGFAGAFLLSMAYASARVAIDDRLIDAEDIEALGLLPVLCLVPRLESTAARRSRRRTSTASFRSNTAKVDGNAAV